MFLTLVALAAALILLEESFTRLVPRTWRAVRWGMLPIVGVLVATWVPFGMIANPAIVDQAASILFGLTAASIVALHGTFRDAHWPQRSTPKANGAIPPHQRQQQTRRPKIPLSIPNPLRAKAPRRETPPRPTPTRPHGKPIAEPLVTVPAILPIPPKNAPRRPPQATPHFTPMPGVTTGRPLRPSTPDPGQKAVRAPVRARP